MTVLTTGHAIWALVYLAGCTSPLANIKSDVSHAYLSKIVKEG